MSRLAVASLFFFSLVGCGGAKKLDVEFVPVSGIVTLDGQPLANADIGAIPQGETMGLGGGARSNDKGEFTLKHARGEDGLPAGTYLATVSLRKNPDGTVPPPNDPTPPIESPAKETLPALYTDPTQTQLTFNVSKGGPKVELKLQGAK